MTFRHQPLRIVTRRLSVDHARRGSPSPTENPGLPSQSLSPAPATSAKSTVGGLEIYDANSCDVFDGYRNRVDDVNLAVAAVRA